MPPIEAITPLATKAMPDPDPCLPLCYCIFIFYRFTISFSHFAVNRRRLSGRIQDPMTAPALAPPRTSPQPRFRRVALFARWLVAAGATLFALNALGTWIFPAYAARIITSQVEVKIIGALAPWTRVMYVLWDIPSLAVILIALLRLWQLFGEYLHSRIFSPRALTSLRGFARWTLVAAFWSPVYRAVLSMIVTWQNGPGKRELTIDLTSDDYMMVLLGVVLLAISSVMVEAARIAEDNEGFV
jgi:hypothetical protein